MSSKPSGEKPALLDERVALGEYLDALLSEAPAVPEPAAHLRAVEREVVRPAAEPEARVLPREIPVAPSPIEKPVEIPVETVTVAVEPVVEEQPPAPESQQPAWGTEPFQALMFKVAGLKLAVPLANLHGVLKWGDTITPMPGHSDHFMGLLQHIEQNVKVIDTAGIIVPPERISSSSERRYGHIILVDTTWGLACDEVHDVITLSPDDVRWRTSEGKRAWLAGTVIEQMCALLNTEGLVRQLETGNY